MPPPGQPAFGEDKRCTHCGSSNITGVWRQHPTSGQRLCNACGQYAENHGGQLPPDSLLQRRPVQPRRMADVRKETAQRRCKQCGSASPGGKGANWHRHPATGEEWLCQPCYKRVSKQLKKQRRQAEAAAAEEQQPGHSSGEADAPEGEQAPSPQPRPVSRKRRQERQGAESEVPAAFHGGPAAPGGERGAGSLTQPEVGSVGGGGGGAAPVQQEATGQWKPPSPPAVQRRQRRKQAQPQHLPRQDSQQQPKQEASLVPTELVEGAAEAAGSEGLAATSLQNSLAVPAEAAGTEAAAAAATPAALAAQPQQGVLPEPAVPQEQLPATGGEVDVYDLLEQATDVAAAAAAGLTPELAAAFAALPPLDARRETFLRRLLQRNQYSAAAAFMTTALRGAGHLPQAAG